MTKGKTAVFYDVKDLRIESYEKPTVTKDKILIKIMACAICTWEQRVYTGMKQVDFPFIGGHEIAAKIIAIGDHVDKKNWQIGDTVVYGTNLACGDCYQCKTGNEQSCLYFDHSKKLEGLPQKGMGGLSDYMLADPKHLFHYKNVQPEEAALTEPLSCVIHSTETVDIHYGDTVVIIGCGIMGLLHVSVAVKSGAVVIASDTNEERLDLARQLGAHYIVNPQKEALRSFVFNQTDGIGAQAVFDTTPIASLAEEAVQLLGNTGKLLLYSSFYPDKPVSFSPDSLHKKSLQILGSANSNSRDFMRAAKMISEGVINVKPFISEIVAFDDVVAGFQSAIKGDKYRVVVKMSDSFEEEK